VEAFTRTLALEDKLSAKPTTSAAKARRREALAGREQAYGLVGDHDAQERDLGNLERLADGAPRRLAEVKNRQAERLLRIGDYAAAAAHTEEAEQAAQEGGDERARGEALRLRAEAYERQGDFDLAQDAVIRALEIFKRIGAVAEETRAMIGSGRIHLVRAQYETAREAYIPIVERINDAGDAWLERIVSNHISVIHMCLGEFETAMAAAERSLEICIRIGDRAREGDNISVCGIILLEVGRYEEARGYFQRALEALGQTGSKWSRADCLVYAGTVEANLNEFDAGLAYLEEAVAVAREIGAKYVEANALVALAGALLRRNLDEDDIDRALEAGTQAAMTARQARLVGPEIEGLSRQAEAMWHAGYLDAALALSTRAIRLLNRQHYVEGSEEEIYFRHFRLLEAAGAPEAGAFLQRAWEGYQRKLGLLTKPDWRVAFSEANELHVGLRAAYEGTELP
jgi:tetratricopeptide (TPR) repeat protein